MAGGVVSRPLLVARAGPALQKSDLLATNYELSLRNKTLT